MRFLICVIFRSDNRISEYKDEATTEVEADDKQLAFYNLVEDLGGEIITAKLSRERDNRV